MSEPAIETPATGSDAALPAQAVPAGEGAGAAGAPRYQVRLTQITGTLIVAYRSTKTYTGTPEQLAAAARKVRTHNLTLGWWGITAIVWNIMALRRNGKAMASLRRLVEERSAG